MFSKTKSISDQSRQNISVLNAPLSGHICSDVDDLKGGRWISEIEIYYSSDRYTREEVKGSSEVSHTIYLLRFC